jgi:vacuolar-type H+-ATPase subunit H
MAPIFEKLNGNFSGKIAIDTQLDATMAPQLETLTANGSLNTRNLNLSGVAIIDHIAEATKREELKNLSAKDLNVDFTIENGRVLTKPFNIKMGGLNLNLSGSTGLDQTIDYTGKLQLATASNSSLNSIGLKINGKFNAPQISIDTQSMVQQAVTSTADKAVKAASKQLGIDLSDAEKQKEELIKTAEQAAETLVAEAEKQKANLVSKAGNNALKKLAAEKAGDALITEAKAQGAKLIAEAEKKGNELIEKVQE